jgi:hypothetical protein
MVSASTSTATASALLARSFLSSAKTRTGRLLGAGLVTVCGEGGATNLELRVWVPYSAMIWSNFTAFVGYIAF